MKFKKRFAFAAALLSLVFAGSSALAAEHADHLPCGAQGSCDHKHWTVERVQPISEAGRYVDQKVLYYLTKDIDGSIMFGRAENDDNGMFFLCLNGHTITGSAGEAAVKTNSGQIVLSDCRGGGKITHKTDSNGNAIEFGRGVHAGATFEMYGGTITGNKLAGWNNYGAGVYVETSNVGTARIYGGTISHNETAKGYGGGLYAGKKLEIYDGLIHNNTALSGGGVYCSRDMTTMSGGTIRDNTATVSGGGMTAWQGLTMTGGTISGNTADEERGGGVYTAGNVTMSGGTISGNTANWYGGGISFYTNDDSLTMSGGEITGNTAGKEGGGVYTKGVQVELSAGAKISGNTCGGAASNLNLEGSVAKVTSTLTGSIGLSTHTSPTLGNPIEVVQWTNGATSDLRKLASDNKDYTLKLKDSGVAALYVGGSVKPTEKEKELAYTGSAQALVKVAASNVQYALGTNKTTAPTSGWSNTIPKGTNAGTYYVWYKAEGDLFLDDEQGCVVVTINKAQAKIETEPKKKSGLKYTGAAQALVSAGSASGGTMQYSLNGTTWSTAVPTATDAGTYTVYYKVAGDANHNDVAQQSINVTIDPVQPVIMIAPKAKEGLVYTGEDQEVVIPGEVDGGTVVYSTHPEGSPDAVKQWLDGVPKYKAVGTYIIRWAVLGDKNHYTTSNQEFRVTIAKAVPAVTAPTAKEGLVYTGAAQELVNAGTASGGTMCYALSASSTTAPTDGWKTAVPTGTAAGAYYVWYKVQGNALYQDVAPVCVPVSIAKATPTIENMWVNNTLYDSMTTADVQLGFTGSVEGTLALAQADLTAGESEYDWTFTPKDTDNYNTVVGKVTLTAVEVVLSKIELSQNPTKTSYVYKEQFDLSGAKVTAFYNDGNTKDVTADVTFDPALAVGQKKVTLSYGGKSCDVAVSVARAKIPPVEGLTLTVLNRLAKTYTFDLTQCLPELPEGHSYGNVSYSARIQSDPGAYYVAQPTIEGTTMSLPIAAVDSHKEGLIFIIAIDVTTDNYQFYTNAIVPVQLSVVAENKASVPAPAAFELAIEQKANEDRFVVTIPTLEGCEYSFDGENWSDANTTECGSGASVTGYRRYKETDATLASEAAIATASAPRLTVKTPKIQPAGATVSFADKVTVEILCETANAEIYYTIDGSDPLAGGVLYAGAFELTDSAIMRAVAVCEGYEPSAQVQQIFEKKGSSTLEKQFKIEDLSDKHLTDALKDKGYESIEQVIEELERIVFEAVDSEQTGGKQTDRELLNTLTMDVKLQLRANGGEWIDATAENFPAEGVTLVLDYPKGTAPETHDFWVVHMFTVDCPRLGTVAGDTEVLIPEELPEGLKVTLTGLSPLTICWRLTPVDASNLPKTGDPSSLLGWITLLGASGAALRGMKRRKK